MMDNNKKRILDTTKNPILRKMISLGWDQYIALSNKVLQLSIPKRVNSSNKELLQILDCLCGEDKDMVQQEHQILQLMNLHINNSSLFTSEQQQLIQQKINVFVCNKRKQQCS